MTLSLPDLALRLTLVVVLCGAVGLEREARDQPAGVRTHVLVGVGSGSRQLLTAAIGKITNTKIATTQPVADEVLVLR